MVHRCCVLGCKNTGNHSFPKEKDLIELWEAATHKKDFRAKKFSKICSEHFKSDDFNEFGPFSGLKNTRRILKKGVVPSIFKCIKPGMKLAYQRRLEARKGKLKILSAEEQRVKEKKDTSKSEKCKDIAPALEVDTEDKNSSSDESEMCSKRASLSFETSIDCVVKIEEVTESEKQDKTERLRDVATQKNYQFYTIESFRNDDKGISFYTGFDSFTNFMFVFNTLCPEVYSLTYETGQDIHLSVEDQFFLTVMKLRRNTEDYELGRFFNVTTRIASVIFVKWINFMHEVWSTLEILPKMELIDLNKPGGLKKYSIRVAKDETLVEKGIKIEHLLSLTKIYCMLQNAVKSTYVPLMSKIYFDCVMMCYFRENVVINKLCT